jgi:hypothetical protein
LVCTVSLLMGQTLLELSLALNKFYQSICI